MHIVGGGFLVLVGLGIVIMGFASAASSNNGELAQVSCLGMVMLVLGLLYLFSDGKPL